MAPPTRIHRLIEQHGVLLLPGCHDALSARILARAGFELGFLSGYAVSATLLGRPDIGELTAPEMAAVARRVCAAAPGVPMLVDADTGGGNPLNVQRTVRELMAAGAAGCILEDQQWPKRCGHMKGKRVIDRQEHAQKIRAAREVVGDGDFFVVARTDARAVLGLDEAIERANAYVAAGADATFVEAPRGDGELATIGQQTEGLRMANMIEGGATPLHASDELGAMGFHLVLHPLTPLYATARALLDTYGLLRQQGSSRGAEDRLAPFEQFNELVDLPGVYALEQRFRTEDG